MFRVGLRKSFSNQRLVEPVAKKQKNRKANGNLNVRYGSQLFPWQQNNETILLKANQIEQVQLLKTG